MKTTDELRTLLDPAHPRYVTGSPAPQARTRRMAPAPLHRRGDALQAGGDPARRHRPAPVRCGRGHAMGTFYRQRRDGLIDLHFTNAVANFVEAAGVPVLLEPPPGPNRAELERQQAEREHREAAPKPRPAGEP